MMQAYSPSQQFACELGSLQSSGVRQGVCFHGFACEDGAAHILDSQSLKTCLRMMQKFVMILK